MSKERKKVIVEVHAGLDKQRAENKVLLTEESIGKKFDVYSNGVHCGVFEVAIKNKDGYWQGYSGNTAKVEEYQFDKYGINRYKKDNYLKPQQEKINLWEWEKENHQSRITVIDKKVFISKNIQTKVGCELLLEHVAIVDLEEMQKRNFEWFIMDEGINE